MSDTYLRLIPDEPTYRPSAAAAARAEEYLRSALAAAQSISGRVSDTVKFVDCGANLERVLCPSCGRDLLEDGLWQEMMDEVFESESASLLAVARCCGTTVTLDKLRYDLPCGFASYVIEAKDPPRSLTDEELACVAAILGCGVGVIWAHN